MTEKRFILESAHFQKLTFDIYDRLEKKHLHFSLYELIDFLNEVSQQEYDLLRLREDVCKKIDLVMGDKKALKNLETVFDVIDNKIKEFQDGEYGDLPCNTIHILLDLKEELSYGMSRK